MGDDERDTKVFADLNFFFGKDTIMVSRCNETSPLGGHLRSTIIIPPSYYKYMKQESKKARGKLEEDLKSETISKKHKNYTKALTFRAIELAK